MTALLILCAWLVAAGATVVVIRAALLAAYLRGQRAREQAFLLDVAGWLPAQANAACPAWSGRERRT